MKRIVLVGSPNSGKTTLYNLLTGSNFRTVNYPGSTVEICEGNLNEKWLIGEAGLNRNDLKVVDTPGTYSLFPKSHDEEITRNVLYPEDKQQKPDLVLLVVDGTQLERQLIFFRQLKEADFPLIVAVTMKDLLAQIGMGSADAFQALQGILGVPTFAVDGTSGDGIQQLVQQILQGKGKEQGKGQQRQDSLPSEVQALPAVWTAQKTIQEKKELHAALLGAGFIRGQISKITDASRLWDRWLLHPWLGFPLFFIIMSLLFSSIYWLAQPIMDLIDFSFSTSSDWVLSFASGNSYFNLGLDFLAKGLIASFGAILVFVPQIWILFFGMGALESSGYLARAASLADRPLSWVGLSGRSFVPLLSGFACAVPAIMAARNISSRREKWIANFIIPMMTCSARLPVYALLVGFLLQGQASWKAGLLLAAIYAASLFVGALAAALLNVLLRRVQGQDAESLFAMELPLYRTPRASVLLSQATKRTKAYIVRAGPVIFAFAILIWMGTTFPHWQSENPTLQLQESYLGKLGQKIEPIFTPMGADWRVGVGLMSAFAAREVFVSSLAVIFQVTDATEGSQEEGMLAAMATAVRSDGQALFTVASVAALIVFFMIALQCMSTVAIVAKETGSYRFAVMQLLLLNISAYILSVAVYQVLLRANLFL